MLTEAGEARFRPKLILQILLFLGVYSVGNAVSSILLTGPTVIAFLTNKELLSAIDSADMESILQAVISAALAIMGNPWIMLVSLFVTAVTTVCCIVYCRKIERRSWASIGFVKRGWLGSYLKGYAIGTGMLLLCAAILWMMGQLDFAFAEKIPVFFLTVFFVGFVIQGMSEEVLVRGYFMVSLSNRCHIAVAIGISSVVFSMLHLANPGISLLALLNLTLFGVFMAVYILRTDDLWGACAIHSAWNFAQGNLVGISVSGNAQMPTVAVMNPVGKRALFHGGDFGLEGGLVVTLVLLAAIALTLFFPKSRKNVKEEEHQ